jgi:UDP-N-acetyl-D-mannosaminuronic acid dehydrogenase
MSDQRVCVIGLGFVGLTLAVALARVGYRVYGIEKHADVVVELKKGKSHFHEPGLDLALQGSLSKNMTVCSWDDMPEVDVYVITVGTPLDAHGNVSDVAIDCAVAEVLEHCAKRADFVVPPLVVLRSTVKVGTTRKVAERLGGVGRLPLAEVAFCPERTLEGKALEELTSLPQIVGGMTSEATSRAAALFGRLTPTILRMSSPEAAEMVKLVSNTHRDVTFGYVNELAKACDALGLSAQEVVRAGNYGYDRTRLPAPGPVGGPCLTKDSRILMESLPVDVPIVQYARATNADVPELGVRNIAQWFLSKSTSPKWIALFGFAFKGRPETDDLRGSPAYAIVAKIREAFPAAKLFGWDPIVSKAVLSTSFGLIGCKSAWSAVNAEKRTSDGDLATSGIIGLVILMNNHQALKELDLTVLSSCMGKPGLIYDFWHQHSGDGLADGVQYRAFGSANKVRS